MPWGLRGAATSRAEAQVLRLSAIYSPLDGSSAVGLPISRPPSPCGTTVPPAPLSSSETPLGTPPPGKEQGENETCEADAGEYAAEEGTYIAYSSFSALKIGDTVENHPRVLDNFLHLTVQGDTAVTIPLRSQEFNEGPLRTPQDPRSFRRQVWNYVSRSPLRSLWNLQGIPVRVIVKNTWNAMFADNLLGRSAELGFYFIFALFPTLVTACSILGLAARSAVNFYEHLLRYLWIVVPPSALGTVLEAFNQTTAAASSGKLTFGLVAALWSASVGFSAIQESLNVVYRVQESRPYWKARLSAIGITFMLSIVITLMLASLLAADFLARLARLHIYHHFLAASASISLRTVGWLVATAFLSLLFALIYYFGPDVQVSHWHWLTPGSALGMLGWVVASLGLRVYVHYINNYSATYGSLGTVIILLTWFYLSGLMLLLGGEINSEIEAAVKEKSLAASGMLKPEIVSTPSIAPS